MYLKLFPKVDHMFPQSRKVELMGSRTKEPLKVYISNRLFVIKLPTSHMIGKRPEQVIIGMGLSLVNTKVGEIRSPSPFLWSLNTFYLFQLLRPQLYLIVHGILLRLLSFFYWK